MDSRWRTVPRRCQQRALPGGGSRIAVADVPDRLDRRACARVELEKRGAPRRVPRLECSGTGHRSHLSAGHAEGVSKPEAEARFADELQLFLRPRHRGGPVRFGCDGVSSLGHVVESLGVPLTEVGSLTVNGRAAGPGFRPAAGDVVDVGAVRRPQRLPSARFILDVHLGTLARRLRLAGLDVAYANDLDDDALIELANAGHRVLLTQDRGLLKRRKLWLGAYPRGARPDDQFRDVLDRFAPPLAPWTRCPACNGLLSPAGKADVEALLQPGTLRSYDEFSRCASCGRVYWRGAHAGRLDAIVDSAVRTVSAAGSGRRRRLPPAPAAAAKRRSAPPSAPCGGIGRC